MSSLRSSRSKTALFYVILVLIPLSVALAAIAWYGYEVTRPYMNFWVQYYGDKDIEFDRELGFVRPPNATTRRVQVPLDYSIFTDQLGARVNTRGQQTPHHVEILTVGCSFSEGHGLANEETFTEQLGQMLSVPVANFSIGSYGGVQSELSLERHADLTPRVVIYGLIEDHLRRNLEPCAPNFFPNCLQVPIVSGLGPGDQPYFTTVDSSGFDGIDLTGDLLKLRENPSPWNRSVLGVRTAYHNYVDWRTHTVLAAESQMNDLNKIRSEILVLQRMAAQARRIHASLVVLNMTRLDGRPSDDRSRGWRLLPEQVRRQMPAGVIFVDVSNRVQKFYAENPGKRLYLTAGDDHPNAEAHRIFAEMLRAEIESRGLLHVASGQAAAL